ncbi:MAG: hypothetical protein AAF697_05830 [Pseudomonadota bacterium]
MYNEFTLSNLLSETVETVRRNGTIALIFLAIIVPASTLFGLFGENDFLEFLIALESASNLSTSGQIGFVVAAVFAWLVVVILAQFWLLAGMVRRTATPGFDRFGAFLGVYILVTLATALGFIALIIPGLVLLARWSPILAIVVGDGRPAMDSFGDAWRMTTGKGWPIFGAIVILYVGLLVLSGIAEGFSLAASGIGTYAAVALVALVEGVSTVIFTALSVSIYDMLRNPSEELTEVFE